MADKSTRLMLDALTRAATAPAGLPLFAAKTGNGLFPRTTAARPVAQRCKEEGLLRVVGADGNAKSSGEVCTVTPKGLRWLATQANPRQVIGDFVRVLEERRSQVAQLIAATQRIADGLDGIRVVAEQMRLAPAAAESNGDGLWSSPHGSSHSPRWAVDGSEGVVAPAQEFAGTGLRRRLENGDADALPSDILAALEQWHANSAGDCPLPKLFHLSRPGHGTASIGAFHDALRGLYERGRIWLHPWTGPLYEMPEPSLALLVGHEVAYYASLRRMP